MTDLASPEVPTTDENQPHLLRAGDSHVIALVKQLIKEAGGVKIDRRIPGPKLAAALALAQGEFTNIPMDRKVEKSEKGFGFSYASLGAIKNVIRAPLAKNGISYMQYPTVHHKGGAVEQYVEVTTIVTHSSGEYVIGSLEIPLTNRMPQQIGIVITYCKRYALNAMFGLAQDGETDLDDHVVVDGPPPLANLTPASTKAPPAAPSTKPPEKSAEPGPAAAATPPRAAAVPGADAPKPAVTEDDFHLQIDESKTIAALKKTGAEINESKAGLSIEAHGRLTEHYKRKTAELTGPKKD